MSTTKRQRWHSKTVTLNLSSLSELFWELAKHIGWWLGKGKSPDIYKSLKNTSKALS
jgi:hypothetical protein